jgi:hypothetical protein
VVEQPGLFYGLVDRRAGKPLCDVARIAARCLAKDAAAFDLPVLDHTL